MCPIINTIWSEIIVNTINLLSYLMLFIIRDYPVVVVISAMF